MDLLNLRDAAVYLLGGLTALTWMRPARSRAAMVAIMIGNGLIYTAVTGLLSLAGVR